jgi:ATP-dependent Lon protease
VLDIEVVVLPASNPARLEITGNLGETLRESALAALTLVRSQIQPPPPECDLHIHVGESGIPKDGPSAGLALSLAIMSALTGTPLTRDFAVTGAVNLHGHVLPVGGIEEKLRAADRAGITRVLVPQGAEHLLQRLPAASQNRLQVIPIRNLDEAWSKTRVE